MKTQLKSLLWAGFFLFSMTQCQICSNCNYATFPPETESYFDFKEGSYWIYKNTTNGVLDSIYVNYYFRMPGSTKGGCTDAYITQTLSSDKTGAIFLEMDAVLMVLSAYSFNSNKIDWNNTKNVQVANKNYEKTITFTNCCLSNNCQNSQTSKCQIQSSIIIKNLTFAPNVGLIRWETETHPTHGKTTFELVRHKTVKYSIFN